MGQFGNQPDFGTRAETLNLAGAAGAGLGSDTISQANNLESACIYVGGPDPKADVTVILAGVTGIQGVVTSLTLISGGTGYTAGVGQATTPASLLGTGLTVTTTVVGGVITAGTIVVAGSGYRQGDVITIAGGSGGQFRINVVDALPTAADAITFTGYPAGSFLPVIVNYVLATGTTATNMVAIY
jgi:hypothetical protein|tara:strand:+ start:49 stop:603 length:555 start_codon:yes stop_codon:yes gene_type:complete